MFVTTKFFKTMVFMSRFLTATFLFFCFAGSVSAQVEITEIMYDLEEGGDGGREWIEICNISENFVNISDLRLFEDETTHKGFKIISGDGVLSAGKYAVIVSDDVKFYIDNPTFSGDVLDSSFSLRQKNDLGEKLVIRDPDGNDIDSVTYDPLWGAKGDGNSLQKVNGSWCAGTPTLGVANINVCDTSSNNPPSDGEEDLQTGGSTPEQELFTTYSNTTPSWTPEPEISTYAGARKRIALSGASIDFEGKSLGTDGKILPYARHVWSFGDGSQGVGKEITHTYYYPGEYVVVLNTASGGYTAMDRISVEVIPADILITEVSFDEPSFIEIHNKTSYELDLSRWQLKVGKWKFTIPQDTFIRPNKKIIFPSQVTKLSFKEGSEINLLYPSGDVVASYNTKKEDVSEQPVSDYVEEKVVIKNTTKDATNNNSSSQNVVKSKENLALSYASTDQKAEEKLVAVKGSGAAKEELIISNINNTAQAANVLSGAESRKDNKEDGLFWGIIGVSLISLVAIYGVLISKEKKNSVPAENEAGLYKIIEIED